MFGGTLQKFFAMRPAVRSLVFLYWIYAFTGSMVGVFVQLYLYQKFTSVSLNVIATMAFYAGIMVGFCALGYVASLSRVNIKRGFMLSFVLLGASLAYFLTISSAASALLAMFFWGIGQGLFWLTVNTFELFETKDAERDFYSSMLNAGSQILRLAGPAFATLLIWLAEFFRFGTYTLLFSVTPFVYISGFFCFSSIRDYRPPRITRADLAHFFRDPTNRAAQFYTLGTGFQQTLGISIVPLVTLFILGTALHVGIYDALFGIFSAVCVFSLASYRSASNRMLLYGLSVAGIAAATVALGWSLTFAALLLYTVVTGILSPISNVSRHVIDLAVMETGRKETDFYATMILRDFFLWVWRSLGGAVFLVAISFFGSQKTFLSVGLYLLAAALGLTFWSASNFSRMRART